MVTGDFDLSGIGTVTHVEGNRVYGFGHPMFSLGACEFPMMTGYIHTVYPRASVSMKMGSPLKVVGVLDTDVSTGVAGRIGPKPDMLPAERPGQDGPLLRAAHLPRPDRPRAEPPAHAGHGGPDQRDRHRGEPPRGADRPDQGDDQPQGPRPDRAPRHPERPALHRADGARRRCSARSPRSSTSWSATRWRRSGSSRSTARSRSTRAGPSRPSSRSGSPPTGSSPARRSRRSSPSSRSRASARPSRSTFPFRPTWPKGDEASVCDMTTASAAGSATSLRSWSRATSTAFSGRSGSRPTRADTRLPPRPAARPRPGRPGPAAAEPARQRPRRVLGRAAEHRAAVRADLIQVAGDPLGRRGVAVAPVHRRQGHGPLAEVEIEGFAPNEPQDRDRCSARPNPLVHQAAPECLRMRSPCRLAVLSLANFLPAPAVAKLETWRQETASAFAKGHRERVVVSDSGRVRLGQALKPTGEARRRPRLGPRP